MLRANSLIGFGAGGGVVEWTLVGETSTTLTGLATDHDVPLPAGVQTNDAVIVGSACDSGYDATEGVQTSGYVELFKTTASDPDTELKYKVMGGTPDTDVTIRTNHDNIVPVVIQVWRGVDTGTPVDATPTTASGVSGMPDAPSYTTVTSGALVFAFGALDDDNAESGLSAPSGYTNLIGKESGDAGSNCTVMLSSKKLDTAGAENPAGFGGAGDDSWYTVTFALRPA